MRVPSDREKRIAARIRVDVDKSQRRITPQWILDLAEEGNGKLESEPCLQEKEFPMSTPIYDGVEKPYTADATGEPTPKPTAKVAAGALTGLALTVVVAVLTAITPDLLSFLGPWAGPAFAGIGALAVALGAYLKRPTGEIN